MSIHEIREDPEKEHRPIKPPVRKGDNQLALPIVVKHPMLLAPQVESPIWRDLGYDSPEAYMEWIKRIASRDEPLFRSTAPGGHKPYK